MTRQFSPEHRAKLSAAAKGRKFSKKHRAALSAARIGKKHSPATLAKMRRKKRRGRKKAPLGRGIRAALESSNLTGGFIRTLTISFRQAKLKTI